MHRGYTFRTPEELRTEVTRAIADYLSAATTPVDVGALLAKHDPVEERGRWMTGPLLHLAVVGGPTQTILRPSEIEDQSLVEVPSRTISADGYFSYRRRTEPHPITAHSSSNRRTELFAHR